MSVHKKIKPNQFSRLAGYRQHIYYIYYIDLQNKEVSFID